MTAASGTNPAAVAEVILLVIAVVALWFRDALDVRGKRRFQNLIVKNRTQITSGGRWSRRAGSLHVTAEHRQRWCSCPGNGRGGTASL
jgi:hypothetical protein